jgi:hypothetical protein
MTDTSPGALDALQYDLRRGVSSQWDTTLGGRKHDARCLAAADTITALRARAEAAEASDAESLAMYRRARDRAEAAEAALAAARADALREAAEVAVSTLNSQFEAACNGGPKFAVQQAILALIDKEAPDA